MKETIELHLKAVDFKGTDFYSPCNCAISKAVKRQLDITEVKESVYHVEIENVIYNHKVYSSIEFEPDQAKATSLNFDNTTIRIITLTKSN